MPRPFGMYRGRPVPSNGRTLHMPAMNFLGHLYLSGDDPMVTVGNFMADGVKGRDLSMYPAPIQEGIRRHRAIDSFTDTHPITAQGRERLYAHAGKYAGVVLDIFYDHLLADEWPHFHDEPLPRFAQRMYGLLSMYRERMPLRTQRMLPHMIQGDWLTAYAHIEGIGRSLDGLSRRVPGGHVMRGAEQVLLREHDAFREEFHHFLPEIRQLILDRS